MTQHSTTSVYLMVHPTLAPRLTAMGDAEFASFQDAVSFAASAIGHGIATANASMFAVAHGDLLLLVRFSCGAERFVICGFEEIETQSCPGECAAVNESPTLAESLLRTAGLSDLGMAGLQTEDAGANAPAVTSIFTVPLGNRTLRGYRMSDGSTFLTAAQTDGRTFSTDTLLDSTELDEPEDTNTQFSGSGAPDSKSTDP